MLINKVLYNDETKNSILDQIMEPKDYFKFTYNIEYMQKLKAKYKNQDLKKVFKIVFGNQQLCKDYDNRTWIWTFSTDDKASTVYCLIDKNGIKWNYDTTSNFEDVIKLKQEIENRLLEK